VIVFALAVGAPASQAAPAPAGHVAAKSKAEKQREKEAAAKKKAAEKKKKQKCKREHNCPPHRPPPICHLLFPPALFPPVFKQYCEQLLTVTGGLGSGHSNPGGGGGGSAGTPSVGQTINAGTLHALAGLGAAGEGTLRLPGVKHKAKHETVPLLKPAITDPFSGLLRAIADSGSVASWLIPLLMAIAGALLVGGALLRRRGGGTPV
jgi:hypothetical protein